MARPSKHDGVVYPAKWHTVLVDALPGPDADSAIEESTGTTDWKEAQQKLRERLQARDDNILEIVRKGEQTDVSGNGRSCSWRTTPSRRCARAKTHEAHTCGPCTHLKQAFGASEAGGALSATRSKAICARRLRQRVRRKTEAGVVEKGLLKPSTVHQEFRVLRRMLNRGGSEEAAAVESVLRVWSSRSR